MKIGLVSPYSLSEPGGVQAQVTGLADRLRDIGDEVRIIGPGIPSGLSRDHDTADLGDTVRIPGNGSMAPISINPRVGVLLKEACLGLDVLHVHEPLMPVVSLAALRAGLPVVATFHADPSTLVRGLYRTGSLSRKLLRNASVITAVSETAASALPQGLEVRLIPNGVDLRLADTDVERSGSMVSFLGRDEKRKGLDVLLEAWPAVAAAVPDAELVVMGAVRQHSGVDWKGRVEDREKFEYLAKSAVYVAPNLGGESFGIVLVEAMAVGAPIVASNLKAFRDVAGDAARFFPAGDTGALAGEISDLLLDVGERNSLSRLGKARAGDFSWDKVVAQYRDAYVSALS